MPATPDRWRRIESLYHSALKRDPVSREAFLDGACGDDEELRSEILSLLAEAATGQSPLDKGIGHFIDSAVHNSMDLTPGAMLGPYRIESLVGQGGMGKVYKALDTRLGRSVALKTSAARFSERFGREARAVAALNHPNICHLYDVGPDYLVMEYVEGTPLKGPLPAEQAMQYAQQICAALDAAHRKGIVHRDLKPGNILLSKQGIKLLDFGLAQIRSEDGDTTITQLTQAGAVMGTPAYMAPEQREGRPADARSDVYSFGCVLFEMLTGKRVSRDRDLLAQPFEGILRTCLEADPAARWQSARELKHALDWAARSRPEISPAPRRWPLIFAVAMASAVLAAAGIAATLHFGKTPETRGVVRLQIDPPPGTRFVEGIVGGAALSPDSKSLAFVTADLVKGEGGSQLWVQPLAAPQAHLLAGAENARDPFWSPDSKSVGFYSEGKLRRIDADGGMLATVCEVGSNFAGAAWIDDGRILYSNNLSGLLQVPASGGTSAPFTTLNTAKVEHSHAWPQQIPGGRFLFFGQSTMPGVTGLYTASLSHPSEHRQLLKTATSGVYSEAAGHHWILWLRGSTLVAQVLDVGSMTVTGEPQPLADPVSEIGPPQNRTDVAIPANGVLVYRTPGRMNRLGWLDRTGKPLAEAGEPGEFSDFKLSFDGRRLVGATKRGQIVIADSERLLPTPFTFESHNTFPVWSPDGTAVVYFRFEHDLIRKPVGAAGEEELILRSANVPHATDWSRDGHWLLYYELSANQAGQAIRDIWVLPMTSGGKPVPGESPIQWTHTPFNKKMGRFSPEPSPRWIAYQSDESGRYEIYIDSFPSPHNKIRISAGGGVYPEWGPGGRELFFTSPQGGVMTAAIGVTGDSLHVGEPRELFRLPVSQADPDATSFQVSPDGQRFLARAAPADAADPLSIILNWPALLHRKSP